MAKLPDLIYLQSSDGQVHDDVTWSTERIEETDEIYIRFDIATPSLGGAARIKKELERMQDLVFRLRRLVEEYAHSEYPAGEMAARLDSLLSAHADRKAQP